MYSNLIRQNEELVNGMFVKNATKDLKQHELSTPITSIVGTNSPKRDMNGTMDVCCVGNVITRFTENTNLRH